MTVMMRYLGLVAFVVLAGCEPEGDQGAMEPGMFGPDLVETQRNLCEARGGRWGSTGGGNSSTCFTTPADAGKTCSVSSDCTSVCLARSRSCAPVTPFFGCHEVLNARGARQTLCIN